MTAKRALVAVLVLVLGFPIVLVWRSSRTSSGTIHVRFPLAGKHMQEIRRPLLGGDVLVLHDDSEMIWGVDVLEAGTGKSRIQSLRLHGVLDSDVSACEAQSGKRDWSFEGGGYAFKVHIREPQFGLLGKDMVTWAGGVCELEARKVSQP